MGVHNVGSGADATRRRGLLKAEEEGTRLCGQRVTHGDRRNCEDARKPSFGRDELLPVWIAHRPADVNASGIRFANPLYHSM
jgi:hypothetical protein